MPIPLAQMLTVGILPSPLKVLYYRLRGAKIGRNVKLGMLSVINSPDIQIGDYTTIGFLTFINCKKITLGKRVKINSTVAIDTGEVFIDNDSVVMEQVVIGGMLTPRSELRIGKRVKIFPYCFLNPTEKIIIEDDVGIGGANYIFTHGSWQSELDGFPVSFGPVTVKRGVWFPWRVFVMPNVTVGEYATIGAGSIITKDIPGKTLAAGSPAKVLRTEEQYIKNLTQEQKHQKCLEYVTAMKEHLSYLGHTTKQLIESDREFVFEALLKKGKTTICYSTSFSRSTTADIVICLEGLTDADRKQLIQDGKLFFDVKQKETFFSDREDWYIVRDFFSRYGVRFEVIN